MDSTDATIMSEGERPFNRDLSHDKEKSSTHVERIATSSDLIYREADEEPELHARTYLALVSMFFLNLVQVFALLGPPTVLDYIGTSLKNTPTQTWVPNSLSLVQAVLSPVISSASDTFQARKFILVGTSAISFIGAAIAPGSKDIYRLIAAQTLIGFGFASVPLAYSVPSEILPRKWRPMAQAWMNVAAGLGACTGPLIIGAMTKNDPVNGWRNYYWVQMALWGVTGLGILLGYRPPKRHTRLDHLSVWQKLGHLDLPGFGLLTIGLTLFLTGLNLGGNLFAWTNSRVLVTLVLGLVILMLFAIYEWKGTTTGILHHDLFRGGKAAGRTFAICVSLIFIEGILLFSYVIFYPVLTTSLFEKDPFLLAARGQAWWIGSIIATITSGYFSTRFRTIREPLLTGFLILTGGIVAFATLEPETNTRAVIFAALAGTGFGAPLILIIAGVQLSTPHHLIATATAVTTSSRAIAATVFTAIYAAAFSTRLGQNLPNDIAKAALKAGLPAKSVPAFVAALASNDNAALAKFPGVNPVIIGAGVTGLKQAMADSLRIVYIIAAPFGVAACIACLFLGDMRKTMNYQVDAPVEDLHAKGHPHHHHHHRHNDNDALTSHPTTTV